MFNVLLILLLLLFSTSALAAAVRYVDVNSTNATPPYTNWATAAVTIQDSVDATVAGDEIVVTNGVYAPVTVDKPLALRSVNGPDVTVIDGLAELQCLYLASNSLMVGFTLTNGWTWGEKAQECTANPLTPC